LDKIAPVEWKERRRQRPRRLEVSDENIIRQSYDDIIRTVFAQFYQASVLAKTAEEKAKAEQIFQNGIAFARQIRDRALAILPPA
jgi:hypothetical protein